jgi:hypothetical protein
MHLRQRHRAPRDNRLLRQRQRRQARQARQGRHEYDYDEAEVPPPQPRLVALNTLGIMMAECAAVPGAAAVVAAVGSAVQHWWPEGAPGAPAVFAVAVLAVLYLLYTTSMPETATSMPETAVMAALAFMLHGVCMGCTGALWPSVEAVCGGAVAGAVWAFFWLFDVDRGRNIGERWFAFHDVLIITQTPRWLVIFGGVGWSLVPDEYRFTLLWGMAFGMDMVIATLFRNSVLVYGDVTRHKWMVASNDVSGVVLVALVVFHSYAAWFSVVPPVWLAVYAVGARHNHNPLCALRRHCRLAWYGVPPLPRNAQCCVCWADVGSAGNGGSATLCAECGVGASTPMSYACEPCRSAWRAVRDECPVCLTAGWPVFLPHAAL